MNKFAKLFESEKYDQICVISQTDDYGIPEIWFFFKPKGLSVCNLAVGFGDTSDAAFESRNRVFNKIDLEFAEGIVSVPMGAFSVLEDDGDDDEN